MSDPLRAHDAPLRAHDAPEMFRNFSRRTDARLSGSTPGPAVVNAEMGNYFEALRQSKDRTQPPYMAAATATGRIFGGLNRKQLAALGYEYQVEGKRARLLRVQDLYDTWTAQDFDPEGGLLFASSWDVPFAHGLLINTGTEERKDLRFCRGRGYFVTDAVAKRFGDVLGGN